MTIQIHLFWTNSKHHIPPVLQVFHFLRLCNSAWQRPLFGECHNFRINKSQGKCHVVENCHAVNTQWDRSENRRHFQTHFLEWKYLYFNLSSLKLVPRWRNIINYSFGWWLGTYETTICYMNQWKSLLHWRIYVSPGLNELNTLVTRDTVINFVSMATSHHSFRQWLSPVGVKPLTTPMLTDYQFGFWDKFLVILKSK